MRKVVLFFISLLGMGTALACIYSLNTSPSFAFNIALLVIFITSGFYAAGCIILDTHHNSPHVNQHGKH